MKKLLTLALGVVVLAAFTGLSAAQEKKAGEQVTMQPPADRVALSATPNIASIQGCPVIAKPGFSGNPLQSFANYHSVNFEKLVGTNWSSWGAPVVTNSQGVTPSQLVPWNTKVRAWIYLVTPNKPKMYSNVFACGGRASTKE